MKQNQWSDFFSANEIDELHSIGQIVNEALASAVLVVLPDVSVCQRSQQHSHTKWCLFQEKSCYVAGTSCSNTIGQTCNQRRTWCTRSKSTRFIVCFVLSRASCVRNLFRTKAGLHSEINYSSRKTIIAITWQHTPGSGLFHDSKHLA